MRYRFRHHPSKLSTLMITFGAGGRVETLNKTKPYTGGIAHFMEHMRFKGTDNYTAKGLMERAADDGGSWNAWTSEDLVSYHMTIPEENIETAFKCLSEVVVKPTFPQDEMEKEQEVVCQEVRMYNDEMDYKVQTKLMELMFDNSMRLPLVGLEDDVRAITRDELLNFDKEFYSPEHQLITLASTADYGHLVEKYFGIPDDTWLIPPISSKVKYLQDENSAVVTKKDQLQNIITIGFGDQTLRNHFDAKSKAAYSVFNYIFGCGDAPRIFMALREDLGLVYGAGGYMSHQMEGSFYSIYTSTEPENSDKVLAEIDRQIELIVDTPPTEEELKRAKNQIKSAIYSKMDRSSGSINEMLAEETFGFSSGSKFLAEVDEVEIEDVNDVVQTIFGANKYTVIGTKE